MTLYLAVTADKYELPLYVTDTRKEMADWYGVPVALITQAISNYKRRWGNGLNKERKQPRPGAVLFTMVEVDD